MSSRIQIELIDDIDGSAADETVTFGLDGVSYEIDLSDAHAAALRGALAEWSGPARRLGGRPRRRSAATASGALNDPVENRQVRAWALENGVPVSVRGRIAQATRDAYEAAR